MGTEKIICDSDILIDYLNVNNKRHDDVSNILVNKIGLQNMVISAITKMEFLAGAQNKEELYRIVKQIARFNILLINDSITEIAMDIIQNYNLSHGLAIPDAFIAATAIYIKYPLFTYNSKDFKFIDGLSLYDNLKS